MTTLASATQKPPRRGLFTNPDYNNCNLYWIMWDKVGYCNLYRFIDTLCLLSDMKCSLIVG